MIYTVLLHPIQESQLFHFCPLRPGCKIECNVAELEALIANGDVQTSIEKCSKISDRLLERNKKCKLMK